jgi:hypothetical protein
MTNTAVVIDPRRGEGSVNSTTLTAPQGLPTDLDPGAIPCKPRGRLSESALAGPTSCA